MLASPADISCEAAYLGAAARPEQSLASVHEVPSEARYVLVLEDYLITKRTADLCTVRPLRSVPYSIRRMRSLILTLHV